MIELKSAHEIERMRQAGFIFLNFDQELSNARAAFCDLYTEKGHGQLIALDGLWVRPPEEILSNENVEALCKYAIFSFLNGAQDLGMFVLLDFCRKRGALTRHLEGCNVAQGASLSPMIDFIEREVAELLFALRDRPRYSADYLAQSFEAIFAKPWVKPGEFYRRYPLG